MLAIFVAIIFGMATDNVWSHTTLFFYWWLLFAIVGWGEEQESMYKLRVKS